MGKLFKVREWLTLEGAAKHLTAVCEEEVSVADLLQLGVEKKLTLSVNLVNHAKAKLGRIVRFDEVQRKELPSLDGKSTVTYVPGLVLNGNGQTPIDPETPTVVFQEEVVTIKGIWDLAMVGGESIDIEYQFHQLTGGPDVDLVSIDGSFLHLPDGTWASIQEPFSKNEFSKIKEGYYPAGGLPENAPLVVRKEALLDFEQFLLDAHAQQREAKTGEDISTKERTTLLTILGLLAEIADLDISEASKAAAVIENAAAQNGLALSRRSIEEHLKRVKQAMQARRK